MGELFNGYTKNFNFNYEYIFASKWIFNHYFNINEMKIDSSSSK
jgi:hypothetical protein